MPGKKSKAESSVSKVENMNVPLKKRHMNDDDDGGGSVSSLATKANHAIAEGSHFFFNFECFIVLAVCVTDTLLLRVIFYVTITHVSMRRILITIFLSIFFSCV